MNGVAWSLEIEIQFYVLVPLLALLFAISDARLRRTIVITLMLVSGMLTNFLYRSPHWHASIIYYVPFFLAGFLLCDLYLSRKDWTRSFVWDVRALCGWPLVWYMGLNSGHVVLPFVIVVLYLAAFRGKVCSAIFSNRVITDIGGMCYSIYVFHFLVIYAVKRQTWPLHIGQNFWAYYTLQSIFIIPWVLLFCGSFFLLVERPCMDREWPRKLWNAIRTSLTSRAARPTIQGSIGPENPQIAESGEAT